MSDAWQNIAAIAAVCAAGCYLTFRAWSLVARRKSSGCGSGCSDCPATDDQDQPAGFVPLDQLDPKRQI